MIDFHSLSVHHRCLVFSTLLCFHCCFDCLKNWCIYIIARCYEKHICVLFCAMFYQL